MTSRVLKATSPAAVHDVIGRLADDLAFPAFAEDLVSVTDAGDGLRRWVLAFRNGQATWVQRSRWTSTAEQPHRIEFEQVDGDFQHLSGSWSVAELGDGCEIVFEVRFGTSVPHLAGAIDSAAGRVLARTAHRVMTGVAGPVHVTSGGRFLADLPDKS